VVTPEKSRSVEKPCWRGWIDSAAFLMTCTLTLRCVAESRSCARPVPYECYPKRHEKPGAKHQAMEVAATDRLELWLT
jgi:hypothetical protein